MAKVTITIEDQVPTAQDDAENVDPVRVFVEFVPPLTRDQNLGKEFGTKAQEFAMIAIMAMKKEGQKFEVIKIDGKEVEK